MGCEGWVVLAVAQRVLAKLGVLEDAHCLVKLQGGVWEPLQLMRLMGCESVGLAGCVDKWVSG